MARFRARQYARRRRFLAGDVLVEGGRWLVVFLFALGVFACQSPEDESADENAPPVVEVTAVDYAFAAPDTVRSGWTTFRMRNEGEEHHLFLMDGRVFGQPLADAAGPDERAAIEGYTVGTAAARQATRSDDELAEHGIAEMEKVHPGIEKHVEGTMVKAWGCEPDAVGHVSWPERGDLRATLGRSSVRTGGCTSPGSIRRSCGGQWRAPCAPESGPTARLTTARQSEGRDR